MNKVSEGEEQFKKRPTSAKCFWLKGVLNIHQHMDPMEEPNLPMAAARCSILLIHASSYLYTQTDIQMLCYGPLWCEISARKTTSPNILRGSNRADLKISALCSAMRDVGKEDELHPNRTHCNNGLSWQVQDNESWRTSWLGSEERIHDVGIGYLKTTNQQCNLEER